MSWYACRVSYSFDSDDGESYWFREAERFGAFEGTDAEDAAGRAVRSLIPREGGWYEGDRYAEECPDEESARELARKWRTEWR